MTTANWWFVGLAALTTFVLGAAFSRWHEKRRRTPEQAAEHKEIHALWRLAKRAPARQLLRDPVTGYYLGVDGHRGSLELLVSEADFTAPNPDAGAVVTIYALGADGRPMPAPILRVHQPATSEQPPASTWRDASELLKFNDQTGAMNTSLDELLILHSQLERALRGR